jgi:lipoprotein-anchoring transpeptidase ErfK/SrfK
MRAAPWPLLALCFSACDATGEASSRTEPTPRGESVRAKPTEPAPTTAAATTDAAPPSPDPAAVLADTVGALLDPSAPTEPEPPEGYGAIKPSDPPPPAEELSVHALAGFEVVAIHDKPDGESPKLGYLRIGTRTMVTPKIEGPGCPKGWHAVAQGGYACASKGLVVSTDGPPFAKNLPAPAKIETPMPYEYAYVRRWNSPMWWRVPTQAEIAEVETLRAEREAERLGKPAPGETTPPATPVASDLPRLPGAGTEPELPGVDDGKTAPAKDVAPTEPTAKAPAAKAPAVDPASVDPFEPAAPSETPPPSHLPLNPQKPWLERGFFVSLGEKITDDGRSWWRTARGAYVSASDAYKYEPKDFGGVALAGDAAFPFGFVWSETAKLFDMTPEGKLKVARTVERKTFLDFDSETTVAGKSYMVTSEGQLIRTSDVRLADQQSMPQGLEPYERWIDVSLPKQLLVAYEGARPVYVTLVSTGRKGSEEEPFFTPPGRYRIRSKHVSTTMDGNTASDGNYSIQDVPWAMFFEGSYALHGAFWHQGFGRVRSHGCVNLGPTDARWLFLWTTPFLPEGWHGVHAHTGSPGTTVVIRAE